MLSEIKETIKQIAEKIEKRDEGPIQLFWSVLAGIVTALLIAGLKFLN